MSSIPSNTEQFLGGLAAAGQNLGIASQNQRAKMDYDLAQQQMGLEREKMAQQGQQFQQGLTAEAENYRKLNESRERLAQAEMGQQQGQFEARMSFDREQANLERLIGIKMKQIDTDMARNEQEIAAMADNDPRLQQARARRIQLRKDLGDMEELMGASQIGMAMAQGTRADRLSEVTARMDAFKEASSQRAQMASQALQAGFQYAMSKDALGNNISGEVSRLSETADIALAELQRKVQSGEVGAAEAMIQYNNLLASGGAGPVHGTVRIALDSIQKFFTGQGDEELARRKMSEFLRNGGAMGTAIVTEAINLNAGAFGLDGPEAAGAAAAAGEVVTYAAAALGMDPRVRGMQDNIARQKIAEGVQKLRGFGMGDEQIAALFDGLETISENRAETLMSYAENDPYSSEGKIIDQSLAGLGRIQDMIQGVVSNNETMKNYGGRLADMSKRDFSGAVRKAQLAYGMSESPQIQSLADELDALGMSDQEIQAITARLIEADPNLQFLRPEQYAEMIRATGRKQRESAFGLETLGEDIGQLQSQIVAEGRLQGLSDVDRRLAELAGYIGG